MKDICSKQNHTGPITIAHHRKQRRCSGWPSVREHATFALQTSTCGSNWTTLHLPRTQPQLECGNIQTTWSKSDLQRLLTSCSTPASRAQTANDSFWKSPSREGRHHKPSPATQGWEDQAIWKTSHRFNTLAGTWMELHTHAVQAEKCCTTDTNTKLRRRTSLRRYHSHSSADQPFCCDGSAKNTVSRLRSKQSNSHNLHVHATILAWRENISGQNIWRKNSEDRRRARDEDEKTHSQVELAIHVRKRCDEFTVGEVLRCPVACTRHYRG